MCPASSWQHTNDTYGNASDKCTNGNSISHVECQLTFTFRLLNILNFYAMQFQISIFFYATKYYFIALRLEKKNSSPPSVCTKYLGTQQMMSETISKTTS